MPLFLLYYYVMASIEQIRASDGSGNASVATVQTSRSSGASTLIVDTVAGINVVGFEGSMGTPHTFTDPITSETITVISEATAVDFTGHVDGSNIEIDSIAPGYTDAGSSVGDIVVIRPTTQWADNVADVLATEHNDDGTHANVTATSVSTDTISEKTAANGVAIDGLNIKDSKLNTNNSVVTTNITDASVTTAKLADNAVTSDKIATDSHILAYVEGLSTGQSTTSATLVDATGITVTFTTPVGCTKVLLRAEGPISCSADGTDMTVAIADGSNTTQVQRSVGSAGASAALIETFTLSRRITVTASTSYTFKLRFQSNGAATVVINNGNVSTRLTSLWVERA